MSNIFKRESRTLSEFLTAVKEFPKEAKPSSLQTVSDTCLQTFYRGHADVGYDCEPSVFRDGLLPREDVIYKKCIEKLPYEFTHLATPFDKLAKMQHYGAATRILDFTVSPEVALYFACKDNCEKDGQVIIYRTTYAEPNDVGVQALSFLTTYQNTIDKGFFDALREHLQCNHSDDFLKSVMQKSYFVIPKITNERLHRQNGLFLIFGQDMSKEKKERSKLDDNFGRGEEYPGYIGYISIPSVCKNSISRELQGHGIDKEYLFPDIDKILKCITDEQKNEVNYGQIDLR